MEKEVLVTKLRPIHSKLRERGVTAMYMLGSADHGDVDSDVDEDSRLDLFFDYDPESRMTLFTQSHLQTAIGDALQREVGFISRKGVRPYIYERIADDLVQVF